MLRVFFQKVRVEKHNALVSKVTTMRELTEIISFYEVAHIVSKEGVRMRDVVKI